MASIDTAGYMHSDVDLKNLPMGLHAFHIHQGRCNEGTGHFVHGFPPLDANKRDRVNSEFSTNVNYLAADEETRIGHGTNGMNGQRSIVIHDSPHGGNPIACANVKHITNRYGTEEYKFEFR